MYERIKYLCKKKGITVQQLEKELGLGNGTISGMTEKSQVKKVALVAHFFNVNISYLIGFEEIIKNKERVPLEIFVEEIRSNNEEFIKRFSKYSELLFELEKLSTSDYNLVENIVKSLNKNNKDGD